mmetsp:Transcript_99626/g.253245  ORF Transcript_99626/g.253245 Transcript_99626/m.253245 type:complete len:655 (+) Transcript_99626:79-2043(+)
MDQRKSAAQALQKTVAALLQQAKERAKTNKDWAQDEGSRVVGRVPIGKFAAAFASASATFKSATSSIGGEERKISSLREMGFSAIAARHALKRCGGRLADACDWLIQPGNADEILAAEWQEHQASPLWPGCLARVYDVRGSSSDLNGAVVTLQLFDEGSQRWMVVMSDGAAKAILPRNLHFLASSDVPSGAKAMVASGPSVSSRPDEDETVASLGLAQQKNRVELVEGFTQLEIEAKLLQLTGDACGEEMSQVLLALSGEELVEALACICSGDSSSEQPSDAGPAEPTAAKLSRDCPTEDVPPITNGVPVATGSAYQSSSDESAASLDDADMTMYIQPPPRASAVHGAPGSSDVSIDGAGSGDGHAAAAAAAERERDQTLRLEELERREAELLESQARARADSEAKEEKIRQLEARCTAFESTQANSPGTESSIPRSPSSGEDALLKERLELQKLQEQVEVAAKELNLQREKLAKTAEERKFRLLEGESEQMRINTALLEEKAHLDRRRKSVLLLQQSALAQSQTLTSDPCIEMTLDASPDSSGESSEDEVWDLDWNSLEASPKAADDAAEEADASVIRRLDELASAEPCAADEDPEATEATPSVQVEGDGVDATLYAPVEVASSAEEVDTLSKLCQDEASALEIHACLAAGGA